MRIFNFKLFLFLVFITLWMVSGKVKNSLNNQGIEYMKKDINNFKTKAESTKDVNIIKRNSESLNKDIKGTSDLSDIETCTKIWNHSDPCEYVRKNCQDLTEGLFDFIELHYCYIRPNIGSIFGIMILTIVLFLLFLMLSTIASDFFCPNLSSIAQELKLSESVAGVTFLAFGNGSPDLFSTFSAFKADSGALAMGELIGAAWFIISVVVGSMAIVKSFSVIRKLFMRDIIFFTGAIMMMLIIVYDRKLTLLESLGLVFYYLSYVLTVIIMNWYGFKGEKDRFKKPPSKYGDLWEEDDNELDSLLLSNIERVPDEDDESTQLISELRHSPNFLNVRTNRMPSLTPVTYYKRMNFWTADEIAKAFNEESPNSLSIPPLLRRRTEFLPTTAKLNSQINRSHTTEVASIPSSHSYTEVPSINLTQGLFDSDPISLNHPITPSSLPFHGPTKFKRNNAPAFISIPETEAPIMTLASPLLNLEECQDNSEPPITIDEFQLNNVESPSMQTNKPTTLFQLLFPGIMEWNELNIYEKIINILCLPFIFLFTLTIPTPLECESLHDNMQNNNIDQSNLIGDNSLLINNVIHLKQNFTAELVLGLLQAFTIPLFLFETILVSNDLADRQDFYWALIVGIIFAMMFLFFTIMQHHYNSNAADYTLMRSLLGFSQSICWISMTATEVVDVLRAFGIIFNISEEILGLTVFAVGNSLGDFVANFAVARMGYPMMAVSACFAGPMLNMMLGPGLAGTYFGLFRSNSIQLPVSHVMTSAGLGVLITLVAYNIYLHYNSFKIGKKFGIALIVFYFTGMVINLILTIYKVY